MRVLVGGFFALSVCAADLSAESTAEPRSEQKVQWAELASESFKAGDFQEVLRLVEGADGVEKSEEALYLKAASHCLSGEYRKSVSEARSYLELYPGGRYLRDVSYYFGVSLARLGYREAAQRFLQKIAAEGGAYQALAVYELALSEARGGRYREVIGLLAELIDGQLGAQLDGQLEVQVSLLNAQALEATLKRDEAERFYQAALELTEKPELRELQAECLFYAISFYGRRQIEGEENENIEAALPYFDRYMASFVDSAYTAQVLAVALPALQAAGRGEEGLVLVLKELEQRSKRGEEAGLRDVAKAYLWARIEAGEKLQALYQELMGEGREAHVAVLRLALAEILARGAEQAYLSWGREMKFSALGMSLRASLVRDFAEVILPSFVELVRGDFMLEGGRDLVAASEAYGRAMRSKVELTRLSAQLGLAKISGKQGVGNPIKSERALEMLEDLERRVQGDSDMLDEVLLVRMHILRELDEWLELQRKAEEYLDEKGRSKERGQVLYFLAEACDKQGKVEEAIAHYTYLFTNSTGDVEISAPSVERLTLLTWARNKPASGELMSDRQIAYQLAQRYLTLIEEVAEWRKSLAMVEVSLLAIRQNIVEWEQSGEVETVEEMLDQVRRGERPIRR